MRAGHRIPVKFVKRLEILRVNNGKFTPGQFNSAKRITIEYLSVSQKKINNDGFDKCWNWN